MVSSGPLPAADEIEVSLFGPGYGESVAVHTGNGDWIVVDSCLAADRVTPAALAYFETIGVDPATSVKLVVATHWHDDHIRGIAKLHVACPGATFACSQALMNEDFITLALATSERSMMDTSGVDEFRDVLEELRRRGTAPRWAVSDRELWRRDGEIACTVRSLTPSDLAVTKALQSIGQLMPSVPPTARTPKLRVVAPTRNDGAVAVWITVGTVSLLLGADVHTGRGEAGWAGVVSSRQRPAGRAKVFKVAHHGASSGDHPGVWSDLLLPDPVAILTPFCRGKKKLPTSTDISRMRSQTRNLYATARYASQRVSYGHGSVARTKREVLRHHSRVLFNPGQIRVRLPSTSNHGQVALWGSAVALGHQ